jgi:UDP-N-acetylmuramate--alanine ligase
MLNSVDFSGRPFHFIGIGGIGMSALAYILAKRNLPVSGSDICLNHITQRLKEEGVHIFLSQEAANLEFFQTKLQSVASSLPDARECRNSASTKNGASENLNGRSAQSCDVYMSGPLSVSTESRPVMLPQVVCSTAINPANSEYRAALTLGCSILHRSDVLAALIQDYQSIAIAGTHGKTTTSSMVGYLLLEAGLDPTIVIGGEVKAWQGNARLGAGPHLVAEADESDGSLVKFAASIGVITNIELDHPDHYANLDEVIQTFKTFAQRCKILIGCLDCEVVKRDLNPDIGYSLDPESCADYVAKQVHYHSQGTSAEIWEHGKRLGELNLKLLGQHNLSNALAAIAIGRHLGLAFEQIASILIHFEGARRRFERRGDYYNIAFIDDYAHHPSEIRATLSAARIQASELATSSKQNRVIAVFQPHRYSRTQVFLEEFSQAFGHADVVVTTDVYSAGESPKGQVNGKQVAEAIAAHHPNVYYRASLPELSSFLPELLEPGDIVLFLGAGNLNQIIPELMSFYQQVENGETPAIL